MAAFSWLMIFLMLLTDDLGLVGRTEAHYRRSVTSAVKLDTNYHATSLIRSIEAGDLSAVENLIEQNVDVNNNKGLPLVTAVKVGDLEIIKTLLQAGAYPDGIPANSSSTDTRLGYPLYLATTGNRMDIVDLLLEFGADVNIDNKVALVEAVDRGYLDIINAFIEAGIDIDSSHSWIVMRAAFSGKIEIVKTLLKAGFTQKSYGRFIHDVAISGRVEALKVLLEAGSNISYTIESDPYRTPLHSAAIFGDIDVIEELVEYGMDINAPFTKDIWYDNYGDFGHYGKGWTVMHLAARWGHQPILRKLMDLGALVNAVDDKGRTPLHAAVKNMKIEVVDKLLELCADSNLPDNKGETANELAHKLPHNMSAHLQPRQILKNLTTDILKLKIKYYPYNKNSITELAREVQNIIDANETMSKQLLDEESRGPSRSDIKLTVERIFEDKAVSGMLDVFEDHKCKFPIGKHFDVPLGGQHLVKCECLPAMGQKLFIDYNPHIPECAEPGQN